MKTKEEVISDIDITKTYIGKYVVDKINEVEYDRKLKPVYLKKGDVIRTCVGVKSRPSVVIKVLKDKVMSLPLTSENGVHNLCPSKSRFFKDSYFCNTYVVTEIELAKKHFISVFDNPKNLNEAIKKLKEFINKNI